MKKKLQKMPKVPHRSVNPNKKNVALVAAASRFHKGPLPTPESLLHYDQVCPGAADRIIKMAEKEQDNIQEIRLNDCFSLRLGIILGFIAFIFLIALTFAAIYYDKPWVATVLVAAVSLCGLFIRKKNDIEK